MAEGLYVGHSSLMTKVKTNDFFLKVTRVTSFTFYCSKQATWACPVFMEEEPHSSCKEKLQIFRKIKWSTTGPSVLSKISAMSVYNIYSKKNI